ncbi:MAG TPA: metallophosphoesterase [Nocardioides sp.]|nr:metallophosphoesterase [Nocardioides sp.]
MTWPRLRHWAGYAVAWLVLAAAITVPLFLGSSRTIEVASHESVVSPDLSGEVVVHTGPVLPDVRAASGSRIGVRIELGKTDASSVNALTQRYAAIATDPSAQIAVVRRAVRSMALAALVRGGALAVLPLLLWAAVGRTRRAELWARSRSRAGLATVLVLVLAAAGSTQPWRWRDADRAPQHWISLQDYVGPQVDLPAQARGIQLLSDTTTSGSRALLQSAIRAYHVGLDFFSAARSRAVGLHLHRPAEGDTVVLLVADRHDNSPMDAVAHAIGEAGGATEVIDAGDDTSAGEHWETFSLDSLAETFAGSEHRWAVAGNHDHGSFVRSYLSARGWTYFSDKVLDGPAGSRIFGADDPRSSGLGNWGDMHGQTFQTARQQLADQACAFAAAGDRITTLVVHDPNIGRVALDRGCVDLVLSGHIHVEVGPIRVVAPDGHVGYTFTVGTTGGAAFAVALGSQLRRTAGVALVTYRDGRPVGIQGVSLEPTGRFIVDRYVPLRYR